MTTLIKTQCPNCNIYFDLPAELPELLHRPNTEMRCAHCQHVFLINENLVVSANDPANITKSDVAAINDSDNAWLEKLLNEQNSDKKKALNQDKVLNELSSDTLSTERDDAKQYDDSNLILKQNHLNKRPLVPNQERSSSQQHEEQSSVAVFLWTIGCLILVLSLLAQYVIFNLDTLLKNPNYAQRLEAICSLAACSLPSADLEAFVIADINFRASKVEKASKFIDIEATLENKSTQIQLLPNLKVSLYDSKGLYGEFIALPDDYLLGRQKQLSGGYSKPFMFTTAGSSKQINRVTIEPLY